MLKSPTFSGFAIRDPPLEIFDELSIDNSPEWLLITLDGSHRTLNGQVEYQREELAYTDRVHDVLADMTKGAISRQEEMAAELAELHARTGHLHEHRNAATIVVQEHGARLGVVEIVMPPHFQTPRRQIPRRPRGQRLAQLIAQQMVAALPNLVTQLNSAAQNGHDENAHKAYKNNNKVYEINKEHDGNNKFKPLASKDWKQNGVGCFMDLQDLQNLPWKAWKILIRGYFGPGSPALSNEEKNSIYRKSGIWHDRAP
ncbi:hypothetical protein E3N88_19988 [Mikania micrantha]|uniref:Uncharacterized protein n=1 Tax=Mikania micrantha TaxID=192012 RepID=A0A5N6NFR3_9ASTR|nr:hypothetical protein E3N88_19988 [Mikania micrantha]